MAVYVSGSSRAASPFRGLAQGDDLHAAEFVADAAADIAALPGLDRRRVEIVIKGSRH